MRITLANGVPAELAMPASVDDNTLGVVLFPDIMGLRPLFDAMCAQLAADHGWVVCAPEPFPGREELSVDERLGAMADFDDAAWDKAVQQNLMSVVRLSRRAIPHMKSAGAGRIVNITALSVLQPMAKFGLSVATWAGVIGYAKTLSLEVAADAITVNTICPGRIATGRLAKVFGDAANPEDAGLALEIAKQVPLGRIGTPDEIAGLVALLVSDYGGYITGSTLHVDGGRHASIL